jgi:galactokinase
MSESFWNTPLQDNPRLSLPCQVYHTGLFVHHSDLSGLTLPISLKMATLHSSSASPSTTVQTVNEDPLLQQREADLDTVAIQIQQRRIENRNKNTIKAYAKGQREWKVFNET